MIRAYLKLLKAINPGWIADKKIRIIAQWALKKNPELADVPLFLDLAKTDAERAALELMLARLEYGRPFFLPPNVPAPRLEALRRLLHDDYVATLAFVDPVAGAVHRLQKKPGR